uniref:Transposase (putative) gypsy type domain-containing protein n=1 Tax=Setaria italica TaxID=4555 RepID=K3XRP0_SETIT
MVVFASFFERGFGIPTCDFFRGLLNYYKIELVHLNSNSVLDISIFIHLCKAYRVKEYFNLKLKESNKGWHNEWFTIANQKPELLPHSGYAPVTMPEWSNQPTSEEMVQVKKLLKEIADLKAFELRAGAPIKNRVHLAYEYTGPLDPTREVQRKVTKEEVTTHVCEFFGGIIKNKSYPKAFSLKRPADPSHEFEFFCPAPLLGGAEQQQPKVHPTTESNQLPADVDSELDSSIGSDEGVSDEAGWAEDVTPVGRRTWQVVKKLLASKSQKPSSKRKKATSKKEKAAQSTTSMGRSASEVDEESDTPNPPAKKKKTELLETIVADAEWIKEMLKEKIRGRASE